MVCTGWSGWRLWGFGMWGRDRLRLPTAFFALRCFLAGIGRFALAFTRVALLSRFARLVLGVRRFAMRTS